MEIKVKKLVPEAVLPRFIYSTDAGADMTAISIEFKDDLVIYGTGLAFEIPDGYCMQIYPRSSIFKYGLELVNSVGIIDSEYIGEVKFIFRRINDTIYKIGDRIGQAMIRQLIPTNYIEVNELKSTERGIGGFGSTDSKSV